MDGLNKFPVGDFQCRNFLRRIFVVIRFFVYLLGRFHFIFRNRMKIIYWSVDNVENCTQVSFFHYFCGHKSSGATFLSISVCCCCCLVFFLRVRLFFSFSFFFFYLFSFFCVCWFRFRLELTYCEHGFHFV